MKIFVDNQIDPQGGFTDAGVSFEDSCARLKKATTIYSMSCGTHVPKNNPQELVETAWFLKSLDSGKELIVDQFYAGTVGAYGTHLGGSVSAEANDFFGISIPREFQPFSMLSTRQIVTQQRLEKIMEWQSLLGLEKNVSAVTVSTAPSLNHTLHDLLLGAKEGEVVVSYVCPFASTEIGKEIVHSVRKSARGWIVTTERGMCPITFPDKIGEILSSLNLSDLQRVLGTSINGKATYRLYAMMLAGKSDSVIAIRDYSNPRGTLRQCAENFGDQLIISKRIYVDKETQVGFTRNDEILCEPPVSRGDTVIFCP